MSAQKKDIPEKNDKKRCFVIGPIGKVGSDTRKHADWVLEGIIRPVLEGRGYLVERADSITTPGNIDSQVINMVIQADLVIADLSEYNANAFYELGLRHMIQDKPVIHMMRRGFDLPFDNSAYRTIFFDHSIFQELERAKKELEEQVLATENKEFIVDTPVSRALGSRNVSYDGTEVEKFLQQRLEALEKEILNQKKYNKQFPPEIDEYEVLFFKGDWVKHGKLGSGTVVGHDGGKVLVLFGQKHVLVHPALLMHDEAIEDEIPF